MENFTTSNFDNLNDLQDVLDETAQDIAQVEPNPSQWAEWIIYLLKALEVKAMDLDPNHPWGFEKMIMALQLALTERLGKRDW